MLYYAEASAEDVDGGIQITGSHNPPNYNGFKMVFQGRPFFGADIQKLGGWRRRETGRGHRNGRGRAMSSTPMSTGCSKGSPGSIPRPVRPAGRLGCGNGAAGPALERLAARLPGEHHLLFTEVDGTFSQSSS
jgi:phosphomannomutase